MTRPIAPSRPALWQVIITWNDQGFSHGETNFGYYRDALEVWFSTGDEALGFARHACNIRGVQAVDIRLPLPRPGQ